MKKEVIKKQEHKRVGIITLYFNYNYGALLQAYSLSKTIEEQGYQVELIRYYREINGKSTWAVPKKHIREKVVVALQEPQSICRKVSKKLVNHMIKANVEMRKSYFEAFIREELRESRSYDGHKEIGQCVADYDIFVCGSDNIWNKNMFDTSFMLDFVPDTKLKIAYAPGMSTNSVTEEQAALITPALKRIQYLSCREEMGACVVSQLTGRTVFRALDPTLLRTADAWETIMRKPNSSFDFSKEYIFCYLCGSRRFARKEARKLSMKTGCEIVTFAHLGGEFVKEDRGFGDQVIYQAGPREFLYLIKHAKYIVTDSFHGTVFSIVFQKMFLCFQRFFDPDTVFLNERIYNLLHDVGISENRIIEENGMDSMDVIMEPIDYKRVMVLLDNRRKMSMEYLIHSLKNSWGGVFYNLIADLLLVFLYKHEVTSASVLRGSRREVCGIG